MSRNRTVHLGEEELRPEAATCPFCAAGGLAREARLQVDPDVWLQSCPVCHICSASRMPTAEALARYYASYYSEPEAVASPAPDKVTFDGPARLARHILRGIAPPAAPRMSILDFGGGDGAVAIEIGRRLLQRGAQQIDVTVVDLEEGPRDGANREVENVTIETMPSLQPEGRAPFDVVLASAVLEHVPDIAACIDGLFRSLGAGGTFYARTACHLPLVRLARLAGRRFDFKYPAHVHSMGEEFWRRAIEISGWQRELMTTSARPSLVSTRFRGHFLRTAAARLMKAPWYVLGRRYTLVGGWEVFIRRRDTRRP